MSLRFRTALVGLVCVVAACRTVGETGRRQLTLVSDDQEKEMGLSAYQEVLKTAKLSTNADEVAMVERVGKRIAAAANRPDFQWEFKLIDEPNTVNAFCLPGGKIAVYTGILPITKTEDGLAAVMGHEVAHATLHHGSERVSQGLLQQLGEQVLVAGIGPNNPTAVQVARTAYGVGSTVGVMLPFSRSHESEADKVGLVYMIKAGYNPQEAVELWRRMGAGGGAKPPEILSTHPSDDHRMKDLEAYIPEARRRAEAK